MIKKLKTNDWMVLGTVMIILLSLAFFIGMNMNNNSDYSEEIAKKSIDKESYDDFTRQDSCQSGCNVMDNEYTDDFNVSHMNSDSLEFIDTMDRITTCTAYCTNFE